MKFVIAFSLFILLAITSYVIYDLATNHLPVLGIMAFIGLSCATISLVIKR